MPKTLLIIYPHWHPANLAGVHRPRLIGNFLPEFGWHPIVLTVQARYFEETPDPEFYKTFAPHFEVHRVKALPSMRPRLIGDIGLRAFFPLKKKALELLQKRHIDFLWIPIPSFYMANLGRILHEQTGIPYGIDYIDPWIRDISNRSNLRAQLSQLAARILEPHAVKKASLISGVAFQYYCPVLQKHFRANSNNNNAYTIPYTAMPYGFDPNDHRITPKQVTFPWKADEEVFLYAGAFLPNAGYFAKLLFKALRSMHENGQLSDKQKFYFIGTGQYLHKSVSAYAHENQVARHVTEIRGRYPFLHILHFLSKARGVVVLGSTEKHYTASKIYQALLSGRPVFAIFHEESSAAEVMQECHADTYLVLYNEQKSEDDLYAAIHKTLKAFLNNSRPYNPDLQQLNRYSAKESARILVKGINQALAKHK